MLCPSCRRQLERGASFCGSCGTPLNGGAASLELVLADATRVPVVGELTIGRAPGSTLVLSDPSVSRVHARISADAVLEDAGLEPRHVARRRARDRAVAAARRRQDPARRRRAARRAPPRGDRGRAHDRRARRARCSRRPAGRGDALRDEAVRAHGLRAQAARRVGGAQALGAARPGQRDVPAALRQRRGRVPDARRDALAGRAGGALRAALRADRPGAAGAAADRPRRARVPRGRGRRAAGRASRRRSGGGGW